MSRSITSGWLEGPARRRLWRPLVGAFAAALLLGLSASAAAQADLQVAHYSYSAVEATGASSDNDGIIGPGDAFSLTETVLSAYQGGLAPHTLTNVGGALSTSSAGVSVTQGSSAYPNFDFGSTAANTTPFQATLSPTLACGVSVPFTLALSATQGTQIVPFTVQTGGQGPFNAYSSPQVPLAIPAPGQVVSRFNVATAGLVKAMRVQLGSVSEAYDGDLQIELIAPDGTDVHLLDVNQGNSGQNFYNTVFDDNASTSIASITPAGAPYTGSFKPVGRLSDFNGHQQQGTWQLKITDNSFNRQPGTLNSWGASIAPAVCTTAPIGSFTATPNPAQVGATVGFDGSGSTSPTGASITGYSWNFGDGSPAATGVTASHPYSVRGKYNVALTVTDANSKTSTTTLPVSVTQPPVAALAATPSAPVSGQTVTYDASATTHDPAGSIVDYKWDLDGSGNYATDTGTTPTVSTSYSSQGTVPVSVRVTDDVGASSVKTISVVVGNAPPVASLVAPSPIVVGQPVLFDGTGSHDIDGWINDYSWNLDGSGFVTTGTTPSAGHTYTTPGVFTVGLRVTDNQGATNTTTRTIQVTRPPVAQLKATPSSPTGGQVVTLDAGGSTDPDGTLTAYRWDLDGSGQFATSTGSTPFLQHAFAPGAYPIKVRVTDNFGATATASLTLTVTAPTGGGSGGLLAQLGPTIGGDPTAGVAALTGGDLKTIVAGSDSHFAAITGAPVRTAAAVAKKGLWVNLLSDRRTTFDLIVSVAAADANRLHIARARHGGAGGAGLRQVTSVSTSLATAGQRPYDIKLPAALRSKLAKLSGRLQLLVTGSAVDAGGHRTALSRAFQVKR